MPIQIIIIKYTIFVIFCNICNIIIYINISINIPKDIILNVIL